MSLNLVGNSLFRPQTEITKRLPVRKMGEEPDVDEEPEMYPPPNVESGMQSLTKLFRVGMGPSSSHTMGPRRASERFLAKHPECKNFKVELFASLAATGKGHLTDQAIIQTLETDGRKLELVWLPDECLPLHPNGMRLNALDENGNIYDSYEVYSVGGGALVDQDGDIDAVPGSAGAAKWERYKLYTMNQVLEWCEKTGKPIHQYVYENEDENIKEFLLDRWGTMLAAIQRGIHTTGVLPGGLSVPRKAATMYRKSINLSRPGAPHRNLVFAYALGVMEENANCGIVVTAPTCGACGVLPAVIGYLKDALPDVTDDDLANAMATAGLIGNIIKTNASVAGAEVGCQGEVGSAACMAAGAACYLLGGSPQQIEYAAEIAMEHFLGLTCDPVEGMVQVPCIERNAFGAMRALNAAEYAIMTDGKHRISFDEVILTMKLTGIDIEECYRETGRGGLATTWNLDEQLANMEDVIGELVEQKRLANIARTISRTLSTASRGDPNVAASAQELARTLSQLSVGSRRASYVDKCKNPNLPVHC